MAKGNLLLGQARGSVGDITFYRSNGQQITRSRNRKPSNPRTQSQMIQRAISATIQQIYSAGKAIFDHSFEGKKVPSGSMQEFLSVNMRQLREDYAADIANASSTGANDVGTFVAPRSNRAVPYPVIVSRGSLVQSLFNIVEDDADEYKVAARVVTGTGTLSDWLTANNVLAGDIYTLVALGSFGVESDVIDVYNAAPDTRFGFIRLTVKSAIDGTKTFAAATLGDVFEIDSRGTQIPDSTLLSADINIDQVVPSCLTGALGVIRSQTNSGLRSNTRLQVRPSVLSYPLSPWVGIKSTFVLDAWMPEADKLGDSALILEGGNF